LNRASQGVDDMRWILTVLAFTIACSNDNGSTISDLAVADLQRVLDLTAGCNTLDFGNAPIVTPMAKEAGAPTFSGGTIPDGTYQLTAVDVYGSILPPEGREVDVVSGSILQSVSAGKMITDSVQETFTISTVGSKLTFTRTCPTAETTTSSYTATATGYIRGITVAGSLVVSTFTKQ
jgi:hypothetical protein